VLDTLMKALTPLDEDERRTVPCHTEVEAYGPPIPAAA